MMKSIDDTLVAFVILHYIVIDTTIECIDSILDLDDSKNIRILVVSNDSTCDAKENLSNRYKNNSKISILQTKGNNGFSATNNLGCLRAKELWNPDFYIVTNNDIVFPQKDFIKRIIDESNLSRFMVLGPDIYSLKRQVHQSPLKSEIINTVDINKTIMMNYVALFLFSFIYIIIQIYFKRKLGSFQDANGFEERQEKVCLMGACLIFSSEYLAIRKKPFLPETFFYYEENLIQLWCVMNNKVLVYNPQLYVEHQDGKSISASRRTERERIKFYIENIRDSALVYKHELKHYKNRNGLSCTP